MPKTTMHRISLYDFVNMNNTFILSVIYHLFIMSWNQYCITELTTLWKKQEPYEFAFCFDALCQNLLFCQITTLFTLFVILAFTKITTSRYNNHNNSHIIPIIMCCSFWSKILMAGYQYATMYKNANVNVKACFESKDSNTFGLVYTAIVGSYVVRLPICVGAGLLLVIIPVGILCERVYFCLLYWSKEIRVTVMESHDNDGAEDV